jgi:hypothetical protein
VLLFVSLIPSAPPKRICHMDLPARSESHPLMRYRGGNMSSFPSHRDLTESSNPMPPFLSRRHGCQIRMPGHPCDSFEMSSTDGCSSQPLFCGPDWHITASTHLILPNPHIHQGLCSMPRRNPEYGVHARVAAASLQVILSGSSISVRS